MKQQQYMKITALAAAIVGCITAASAQSYSYFYGENVQGTGYTDLGLLPADFNMEQYNENPASPSFGISSGATSAGIAPDAPSLGTTGFSTTVFLGTGWGQNHVSSGFDEVVNGVSLYLWVSGLSPNGSTTTFQIYDGLTGRAGGLVGNIITLSEPTNELSFVKLDIPASLWDNGFSIGKSGTSGTIVWNTVTEDGVDPTQRPGFAVSTSLVAVPEPASALIGGLGLLGILRRRRA